LYEYEFRLKAGDATADIDTIVAKNIEPYAKALGDIEFVYALSKGVVENTKKLDEELRPLAPEWPIDSIAAIDRNVLRIGLFELESQNVPPKVAINEAVELAKAFGSDNSSKFINGVLGTAYRNIGGEEQKQHAESEKSEPASQTESEEASGAAEDKQGSKAQK
jgi:N utilization substance protein B